MAAGEPPGQWYGAGAAALGLEGDVDADLMEAVYTRLLDPRDPAAHSRATWEVAVPLAAGHRKYRSADEVYDALLEANPDAGRSCAPRPAPSRGDHPCRIRLVRAVI